MKGLLLLIGSFGLLSFQLFGIEEDHAAQGIPSGDCPAASIEKIIPVLFPASSPAIIPDSPRLFGEQNGSDHSNKDKASLIEVQKFFFSPFLPTSVLKWTSRTGAKPALFILFRNLRL